MADNIGSAPDFGNYGAMGPALAQYAALLAQAYGLQYDPTTPPISGPVPPSPASPQALAPGSMTPGMPAPALPPASNVATLPATPQQMGTQAPPIAGPAPQPQQQPQQGAPQGDGGFAKMLQQLMQPAQPMQLMPPQQLNIPRQFNMANAYGKIPLPPGFTGFQS